ncbi:secreted esterase/lipase/thioesterase family protein [Trichinella spiralis]|uniref:secreted esterase/lipase/thioesterase family protein n=1 Tax=Trichinella spiralis TaxID=6334 RepID=UPI0001EFD712|nr:secreted esterase/lipase/thioesterase family protein [Trichinella spiralis]
MRAMVISTTLCSLSSASRQWRTGRPLWTSCPLQARPTTAVVVGAAWPPTRAVAKSLTLQLRLTPVKVEKVPLDWPIRPTVAWPSGQTWSG